MFKFIITSVILFSNFVFAGEFSKIDLAVRDAIETAYSKDWDDDSSDFSRDDIWGLEISKAVDPRCFIVVSGYAKKGTAEINKTYKFFVCIIKDRIGSYNGYFIEDKIIAEK